MTKNQQPHTSEDSEQAVIFEWAQYSLARFPALALMFHIPNGGKRSKVEAARFKAQGVKAGVPDIFLPAPRGKYHGLFIELKAEGGRASREQEGYIKALTQQGYYCALCFGATNAINLITRYLEGRI